MSGFTAGRPSEPSRRANACGVDVETQYLSWTATALVYPGAGVYVGFAPHYEHELVAHKLNQKQVRLFSGGAVIVRQDRVSALRYYAVRDPSAVKVKPIDRPPSPEGQKHVYLLFDFVSQTPARPADAAPPETCEESARVAPLDTTSSLPGFILSIGMPIARESWFHQQVVCAEPQQTLEELCRRIVETGRAEG